VAAAEAVADVTFVTLTGDVDPDLEELCLVLVRPATIGRALRSLFGRARPAAAEVEARVQRAGP
jgi:hypothetical protein